MTWLRFLLLDLRIAWHYFRLERGYRKDPWEELERLRERGW